VFLQGRNLLDEDIRNSTSYLRNQAPQIGRNYVLGVRAMF
jgi:iron complex outermembrane receptor protein